MITFFRETNTLPLHSEVNGGSHTPTGPIAVQVVILQLYFSWSIIMVWFGAQEQLTLLAYSVTYRSQVRLDHLRRGGHATTKQKRRITNWICKYKSHEQIIVCLHVCYSYFDFVLCQISSLYFVAKVNSKCT